MQVKEILDASNRQVKYARPGENVQIKLLHISEENQIAKGDVLCPRDAPIPESQLFEVDMQLLELLDYKPIFTKGYNCMMHLHTFAEDIQVKDLIWSEEKNPAGELVKTECPKFVRSNVRVRARLTCHMPVPLEKFEVAPQLGQFTLRDEGKTIATGSILRYKPYNKSAVLAQAQAQAQAEASKTAA